MAGINLIGRTGRVSHNQEISGRPPVGVSHEEYERPFPHRRFHRAPDSHQLLHASLVRCPPVFDCLMVEGPASILSSLS